MIDWGVITNAITTRMEAVNDPARIVYSFPTMQPTHPEALASAACLCHYSGLQADVMEWNPSDTGESSATGSLMFSIECRGETARSKPVALERALSMLVRDFASRTLIPATAAGDATGNHFLQTFGAVIDTTQVGKDEANMAYRAAEVQIAFRASRNVNNTTIQDF